MRVYEDVTLTEQVILGIIEHMNNSATGRLQRWYEKLSKSAKAGIE